MATPPMKRLLTKSAAGCAAYAILATNALASNPFIRDDDRYEGAVDQDFRSAVISFINYFLGFLGLIAVVMIIYAGVLLVTGAGEEEQINKGKKIILWSAIGILVIMLAYTFVRVITGAGQFASG